MANALKCDRCNGYFDYSPDAKNFIAFGHKDIIVGKNFPTKDICPNCMETFLKWFEKPKDCLVSLGNADERVNNLYKEAEWSYSDDYGNPVPCHCTNCGCRAHTETGNAGCQTYEDDILSKFCPDCGARMDLKDGDTNG